MGRKAKDEPRQKVSIRLDLEGALKDKFEYLKKTYGITINKQLVETLIILRYEEMRR